MTKQKIRITRKFTFDMAHALYGHNGLCKNIHGHTYHLSVRLIGSINNSSVKSFSGMVLDFSELKELVKSTILNTYDHALVLNADSPHARLQDLNKNFERIVWMEVQPTCENLLMDMVEKLRRKLPPATELHSVKLQETPTSWAEWFAEDNL